MDVVDSWSPVLRRDVWEVGTAAREMSAAMPKSASTASGRVAAHVPFLGREGGSKPRGRHVVEPRNIGIRAVGDVGGLGR